MISLSEKLADAQKYAFSIRPKVGGFPYLAEVLRQAGVIGYDVDFISRVVIYYGVTGESYLEEYPAVVVK